jgi:hypothetical protein
MTSFEKMDESRPGEEAMLNPKNYLQTDFFCFFQPFPAHLTQLFKPQRQY